MHGGLRAYLGNKVPVACSSINLLINGQEVLFHVLGVFVLNLVVLWRGQSVIELRLRLNI